MGDAQNQAFQPACAQGSGTFGKQVILCALGGTRVRSAPSNDIIRSAADDVGEVGSMEGRDHEIKRTSLHGLHVKSYVHNPCHDDHLDRMRRPLGNRQNIGPSSVREVCIGKHEWQGVQPAEHPLGLCARFRLRHLQSLALQGVFQRA